jgi:cell division protease FtsH
MEKRTQLHIWYAIAAFMGLMLIQNWWHTARTTEVIPYSDFQHYLDEGRLARIVVTENYVRGEFKEPLEGKSEFVTTRVDPRLADELKGKDVEVVGASESNFFTELLSWVVPILIFFAIWAFVFRRFAEKQGLGGLMSVGRSRAKVYVEKDTKVTFKDVAGVDEGKDELAEIVEFLKDRKQYGRLGARLPKGILLVGRARSAVTGMGGHDEREQTLNQLLTELDGFDPSEGVILLGATNRPEILDPALLRAGRFDRQVLVDRPDKKGRLQILEVHVRKVKLATEIDLEQVASMTTGFSGADLANLVNEAALLATRRRAESITLADFTNAIERIVAGLEKRNRLLNPREREIVANHEMGHALVAMSLPGTDPVHKVSIVPRGVGALGYTIQRPTEDRFLMTREELENKIAVILGGRAAEKLIYDHLSTGAADDLVRVTDIARGMVTRFGMDEKLGPVAYVTDRSQFLQPSPGAMEAERRYSEDTAREIDVAVRSIIDRLFDRTLEILRSNRDILERCARELLQKETLDETELKALTRGLHGYRASHEAIAAK